MNTETNKILGNDKKVDPELLNTMFTLMANFSSEQQSKVEDIRQEYQERENKRELEHAKQIACLNNKNKLAMMVIGILGAIIISIIVVFGVLANNAINKHYEMDKVLQEDIVVEFETELTTDKQTDEFSEITTGDNANIGSDTYDFDSGGDINYNSNNTGGEG